MRAAILVLCLAGCGSAQSGNSFSSPAEPVSVDLPAPIEAEPPSVRFERRTITVERHGPGWSQVQQQTILVPVDAGEARYGDALEDVP